MTGHELARQLLEMPDVPVTVRGYEGGVNIISHINPPAELALKVHEEWCYGSHEFVSEYESHEDKEKIQAIYIG